ncbi:MAG: peptidase A24 [Pelotomaculum sp.]|uniref:Type II secretory pathway, prepilin signal peptidase PulO and related peptidases, prepilin signal peptidase PulO and related peptidases n=1 Tax=Pelotomaculum thermopropionicum (strain DSM 13744 / JCM 10971 / SI) TaxID=370438 RepID=A5D2B2_PELTS|nr:peptidase A24 [Pelotomaculum sp.]BAF59627.1 type II secretory pathway, prepilin signal peptidase PulO and related peptidases, prepilin signal peptidase PulO and related peptidases [Pelotomaculum thermopropionicum SI]
MLLDILTFIVLVVCTLTDLCNKKIYNFVLLPALVIALFTHLATGGLPQGWWSVKGLLLGIALLFIPFSAGGIGAGDVKMLGVIGALKGPEFVFKAFLAGAVAGGIISAALLIKNKKMLATVQLLLLNLYFFLTGVPRIKYRAESPDIPQENVIPYGAAIAIGTLAAYLAR